MKIDYSIRSKFYDEEVYEDQTLLSLIDFLKNKFDLQKIIYCPCASGVYLETFSKMFCYSYFVDLNKSMVHVVNEKIELYKIKNVEALNLNMININKLEDSVNCVFVLHQGIQYLQEYEIFKFLDHASSIPYLFLDMFDFSKEGKTTYFDSSFQNNVHYLSKQFYYQQQLVKRYNQHMQFQDKINFRYIYDISGQLFQTEFELYNYSFEKIKNIICQHGKYHIRYVYCDSHNEGHFILFLERKIGHEF